MDNYIPMFETGIIIYPYYNIDAALSSLFKYIELNGVAVMVADGMYTITHMFPIRGLDY